jgi:hypothetical protein
MKEKIKKIHDKYVVPCEYGITSSDLDLVSQEIEHLVNLEVERRIKERMPSDVDSEKVSSDFVLKIFDDRTQKIRMADTMWGWQKCLEWLRSRLTPQVTPQDTPQVQKTEGGKG